MPPQGAATPVIRSTPANTTRFEIGTLADNDLIRRNFAGRLMVSTQEPGRGRNPHLICERVGPFAFGPAMVTEGEKPRVIPRRWTLFGLPLPRALMPRGNSYEAETDGKFRFHVEIALPLIGPVVSCDGWLEPA